MTIRKKLIEVSIPLEAINKASAREKSIRHGHPSTLHLWWARRPLAACRAVLFSQLVDDPSSWPDRFPTEEAQDKERARLHRVIERMVPWEASNNETILNEARWEIARSVAWGLGEEPPPQQDTKAILDYLQTKAPPVYDPFSGGGSIPLEAQRLGLRAYGSDLNPVAVLIGKALVEIPPKFAGRPPVNPKAQAELKRSGGTWTGQGAQGLADDVRYYGQWMRNEAEKRIGHLYPKAKLADGSEATVIAWLWARTVRSPDPAAKGAMVPLVSSFMLSTKEGKKAWAEAVFDSDAPDGYRFNVKFGAISKAEEERLKKGTRSGKAQAFVCLRTQSPIERTYIQNEGKLGRLGIRMMGIIAEGDRKRVFLSPDDYHQSVAVSVDDDDTVYTAREGFLSPETPTRAMITGGVCSAYGLRTLGHLFTSRQIFSLSTFSALVTDARQKVLRDATGAFNDDDSDALHMGGQGAVAYADAIATYVSFIITQLANHCSTLCGWNSVNTQMRSVFARQSMTMTWDFAEVNILSESSGSFKSLFDRLVKSFEGLPHNSKDGIISSLDARQVSGSNFVFSTDPPYYDNIAYAVLSDFFYVWLKRSLQNYWPDLFRRLSTPKSEELIATAHEHGGRAKAELNFLEGMGAVIAGIGRCSTETAPLAIYYAFKQSEQTEAGITSAGWAAFLQAIVGAGLGIDGTWPLDTEKKGRTIEIGANALASSIVLVCRKRPVDAPVITRADFIRMLKRELPGAIDDIRKAGVGPVDMQQSVIGPGMGVFSRHARVLEDDDTTMSVRTALTIINRVWGEIENEGDASLDAETQVALAWFGSYGFDAKSSGELITLANAKNIPTSQLFKSDVFDDLSGKAGLKPRDRLSPDWTPAGDTSLTIWECVQHTARALGAEDGGDAAAARLIAQMGPKAADARSLAYRLFQIATDKGWAAEALVYNELATEWPRLEALAEGIGSAVPEAKGKLQYDLL